jgi:hypothetical protein
VRKVSLWQRGCSTRKSDPDASFVGGGASILGGVVNRLFVTSWIIFGRPEDDELFAFY